MSCGNFVFRAPLSFCYWKCEFTKHFLAFRNHIRGQLGRFGGGNRDHWSRRWRIGSLNPTKTEILLCPQGLQYKFPHFSQRRKHIQTLEKSTQQDSSQICGSLKNAEDNGIFEWHNKSQTSVLELTIFNRNANWYCFERIYQVKSSKSTQHLIPIRASAGIAQRPKPKDRTSKEVNWYAQLTIFNRNANWYCFETIYQVKSLEKYSAKIPRRACADAQRSKNPNRISNKANGDYRTSKFTWKWPKSLEFCQFR